MSRSDATLVLLHGIGAGGAMFDPMREALGERFPTLAWNMPGYEGAPAESAYDFARLAELVIETLDAHRLARAVLFGHSIGGMVAQEVALRSPERVRALILSGTTPAFGSRDGSFQKTFLEARLAPLDAGRSMPELAEANVPALIGDDPHPEAAERAKAGMATLDPAAYRAALECLVTFNRRDAVGRIAAPTLLIAGEKDGNAPIKTMRRMAETIPGARLVALAGVGHLAPLERPREVAAAVADFLDHLEDEA